MNVHCTSNEISFKKEKVTLFLFLSLSVSLCLFPLSNDNRTTKLKQSIKNEYVSNNIAGYLL